MSSASNTLSNTHFLIDLNYSGSYTLEMSSIQSECHTIILPNKKMSVEESVEKRVSLTFLTFALVKMSKQMTMTRPFCI